MATKEKLETLNAARVKAGMKPLKAWKDSAAKLDAAIAKLTPPTESIDPEPKEKKLPKKADGVSLVEIAKDLGMNDKVARAKLRRLGDKVPAGEGDRWVWSTKDVETVKELLGGDRRLK